MPYFPGALAQDWAANNRVATRELLLSLAMSDKSVLTEPKSPKKLHQLNNNHVLYEIYNPARAREIARSISGGTKLDPITVQEMRLQHLLFYVVIDGNHRSAAVAYLGKPKIHAKIVSSTDLTGIAFMLGPRNSVLVETNPRGKARYTWKVTTHKIQSGVEKVNFQVMSDMSTYAHVRDKELLANNG